MADIARTRNRSRQSTLVAMIVVLASTVGVCQETKTTNQASVRAQRFLKEAESLVAPLDASYRDSAYLELVAAHTRLGDTDYALSLAKQIQFVPYRQSAVIQVATVLNDAGDRSAASRVVQDFKQWMIENELPHDPVMKLMSARQREMAHVETVITCLRDIGTAQVGMGDSAAALQTCAEAVNWIRKLDVPEQRWVALRDLAGVQADAGDFEGALSLVSDIADMGRKSEAIAAVLHARAKAGDADGVLHTLESDLSDSLMGMSRISVLGQLAARTDSQAVNALLREVRSKARSPEQRKQIESLIQASMFDGYLQTDNFEAARQLLATIADAESKARFALPMAEKQAQMGDATGSLETLSSLQSPGDRVQEKLAKLYAQSGAMEKAREALTKLQSPSVDPGVHLALAEGYALASDSEAAVAQIDLALQAAKRLPAYHNPDQYNGRAAAVYALLGNYERAVELLESTRIGSEYAWRQAAAAAAKTGGEDGARTLCNMTNKPVLKAFVLIGIADSGN